MTPREQQGRSSPWLSPGRRTVAIGSAVVILSSLLAWKQTRTVDFSSATIGSASENGLHSWGVLTVLIAVATLAYLIVRSPRVSRTVAPRKLPVTDAAAFAIAGCAEIATIILFSNHFPGGSVQLGFFVALAGAAATALGGAFGEAGCWPLAPRRRPPRHQTSPRRRTWVDRRISSEPSRSQVSASRGHRCAHTRRAALRRRLPTRRGERLPAVEVQLGQQRCHVFRSRLRLRGASP